MAVASAFPTSLDIYHRLKTDAVFLSHLASVSYFDSVKKKLVAIPLTSFRPVNKGGDVPWHRVFRFDYDGKTVWDRDAKACHIEALVRQQVARIALPATFRVMTYNVLSESLHPTLSKALPAMLQRRMDELIRSIIGYGADIVCLQEVSEAFAGHAIEHLQETYPFHAQTSELTERILILSKATIVESKIIAYPQQQQKQGLLIRVMCYEETSESEQAIDVVGLHLTSNSRPQSKQKRMDQYRCIRNALDDTKTPRTHAIVLGDFNTSELDFMTSDGGDNLCSAITEEYVSYDPVSNPLAKLTSRNQLRQNYDKILVRAGSNGVRLIPVDGSSHIDSGNTMSDHYPVSVKLQLMNNAISDAVVMHATTVISIDPTTALALLPPLELWPQINGLRTRCEDPAIEKWMPHINWAHGFLPLDGSNAASASIQLDRLAACLGEFPAFDVTLDNVAEFEHEVTRTYFAAPDAQTLARMQALFQSGKQLLPYVFPGMLNPHLTLGKRPPSQAALNFPWSWHCDALYVLQKSGSVPYYRVARRIPLKKVTASKSEPHHPSPTYICRLLAEQMPDCKWEIGGSGVFDDTACGDADLVASCANITSDAFFSCLMKILQSCAEFTLSSIISSAHGAYVKTHIGRDAFFPIDIHFVGGKASLGQAVLDESRHILSAIPSARRGEFVRLLARVKHQAHACHVYGSASGFVPGIGWAILTATACLSLLSRDASVGALDQLDLRHLFATLDLTVPIRVDKSSVWRSEPTPADRWMIIGTSCEPHVNVVRSITRSTKAILVEALASGLDRAIVGISTLAGEGVYQFTLRIRCDDDAYLAQLQQAEATLKELLPKLIIRLDHEVESGIRPFEIRGSLSERKLAWRIGYNESTTIVQHYGDKLVQKLQQLFPCLTITSGSLKKQSIKSSS